MKTADSSNNASSSSSSDSQFEATGGDATPLFASDTPDDQLARDSGRGDLRRENEEMKDQVSPLITIRKTGKKSALVSQPYKKASKLGKRNRVLISGHKRLPTLQVQ